MEVVGVWRVVDDEHVFHVSAQQGQVFDVAALEAEAVLAVQAHRDQRVLVEGVDKRVCIDAHGCRVEDDFINGRQLLQEKEHARPDEHIHLNGSTLNHDPHLKVAPASGTTCTQVRLREL